jgi:hypothetical protein
MGLNVLSLCATSLQAQCLLTVPTFRALMQLVTLEREELPRLRAGGTFPSAQSSGPRLSHPLATALWPSLLHALPGGGPALHLAAVHAITAALSAQPLVCSALLNAHGWATALLAPACPGPAARVGGRPLEVEFDAVEVQEEETDEAEAINGWTAALEDPERATEERVSEESQRLCCLGANTCCAADGSC